MSNLLSRSRTLGRSLGSMRWHCPFVAGALAVATAGCGTTGSPPPRDGRTLFTQACGACHTLNGADSPKHQGGDLLNVHMGHSTLLQFAREMPIRRRLTSAELSAVADYILAVQRRGG